MTDSLPELRERLIAEMRGVFGADARRISHALAVLAHAEELLALAEADADAETVVAAAVLHDIGIHEAERKHHSATGNFQELEGPPIARAILERLGFSAAKIEHICRIVGSHHSARGIDTPEFRILWDADWLVNFADECSWSNPEERDRLVGRIFKTGGGAARARQFFGGVSRHSRVGG